MKDIARPLVSDEQILSFLDAIEFRKYLSNAENAQRIFPGMTDCDAMLAKTILLIKNANKDLINVIKDNTYESRKYRSVVYKTNNKREELRSRIINELIEQVRLSDDEKICLGNGGMLPVSGALRCERTAVIIIGLPASGKSGVAAKVSDYYDALLIDSDFAKRKFPEFGNINGASLVHKESKIIQDEILSAAIYQKVNIVLPIIGSQFDGVCETIQSFKKHKYKVRLILIELERVKATQRALCRFIETRRYVPLSRILDDYSNNPSLVFYKLLADKNFAKLPVALINTDVPRGTPNKLMYERNFDEIHKMLEEAYYG